MYFRGHLSCIWVVTQYTWHSLYEPVRLLRLAIDELISFPSVYSFWSCVVQYQSAVVCMYMPCKIPRLYANAHTHIHTYILYIHMCVSSDSFLACRGRKIHGHSNWLPPKVGSYSIIHARVITTWSDISS